MFTYPLVDCICEIWGKRIARQTVWLALGAQVVVTLLLQLSIITPHAAFRSGQDAFQTVLASSGAVVIASLTAFLTSQLLDIVIYQRIKERCGGRWLWLRANASTVVGQIIDSAIFISIVFAGSTQKWSIFTGSITVKVVISILVTPMVYLIVMTVSRYIGSENTLAFRPEVDFAKPL